MLQWRQLVAQEKVFLLKICNADFFLLFRIYQAFNYLPLYSDNPLYRANQPLEYQVL